MTTYSRRDLLATAITLAAASTIAGAEPAMKTSTEKTSPALVHHVFFWLKNPQSKEDLARLLQGLRTLAGIATVRGIHIGVPAATEQRSVVDASYSASELLFFDDVAGQNVYQEHPIHQKFVADCSHLWERVVVYDAAAVAP
jgi:hypothetical protein